jgi:hypothetical protein
VGPSKSEAQVGTTASLSSQRWWRSDGMGSAWGAQNGVQTWAFVRTSRR